MLPRFERDAGTGYAEGEPFEDIEFDFFAERSGDDLIEEGNDVSFPRSGCHHRCYLFFFGNYPNWISCILSEVRIWDDDA